jgi:hypothetical protein
MSEFLTFWSHLHRLAGRVLIILFVYKLRIDTELRITFSEIADR